MEKIIKLRRGGPPAAKCANCGIEIDYSTAISGYCTECRYWIQLYKQTTELLRGFR